MTFEDKRCNTKGNRCIITCMEPGCKNKIHYRSGDSEVPMYCCTHRTVAGRRAAMRKLSQKEKDYPVLNELPEIPQVVLRCTNPSCHYRMAVDKSKWFVDGKAVKFDCPKCKTQMIYHKDALS